MTQEEEGSRKGDKKGKEKVTVRSDETIRLPRCGLSAKIKRSFHKNHHNFNTNSCKHLVNLAPSVPICLFTCIYLNINLILLLRYLYTYLSNTACFKKRTCYNCFIKVLFCALGANSKTLIFKRSFHSCSFQFSVQQCHINFPFLVGKYLCLYQTVHPAVLIEVDA